MAKREFRYFFGFLDTQQDYLNKMAGKGLRLVRTGKLSYEFEPCKPGEFQYCVEFVAHKSVRARKDYREFLESMGYVTFEKNMNLNYSVGKVRWRPYGEGMGQIATNPGSFNRELLIIEKKDDGRPFELHTTAQDKMNYYRPLRNAYFCLFLFACVMALLTGFGAVGVRSVLSGLTGTAMAIIFLCMGFILLIPTAAYQRRIGRCRKESAIRE